MSLMLDENAAKFQVRGFKPGMIRVNDQTLTCSVIISPYQLIENWEPEHIDQLTSKHFDVILTMQPDILLIGTGETLHFLSLELYGELINKKIGVEMMNTAAACRTFNALTAEGRNVVAALIIK